jgi:hypothetical protein
MGIWSGVFILVLGAGCDRVYGLHRPDGSDSDGSDSTDLRCESQSALLCADFEHGETYYANELLTDLPVSTAKAIHQIDERSDGGHALHVDTTGDFYRVSASSTVNVSALTATFDLQLEGFEAGTPASSLVVLGFEGLTASSCYVSVNFEPSPDRLILVEHCVSEAYPDLVTPLPSSTAFVSFTFQMNLATHKASVQVGMNLVEVTLANLETRGKPFVDFGVFDPINGGRARVGLDNLLVLTMP